MKTAILINEILEGIEKLIKNIKTFIHSFFLAPMVILGRLYPLLI